MTTGMPSPPVSASTASRRPSPAGTGSAPSSAAVARRASARGRSRRPSRRAPRATSTTASPIGPAPSTSTVSSGRDRAAAAGLHADRHRLGEARLGSRRGRPGSAPGWPTGAITYSAKPPSRCTPMIAEVGAAVALADAAGIAVAAADEGLDHDPRAWRRALGARPERGDRRRRSRGRRCGDRSRRGSCRCRCRGRRRRARRPRPATSASPGPGLGPRDLVEADGAGASKIAARIRSAAAAETTRPVARRPRSSRRRAARAARRSASPRARAARWCPMYSATSGSPSSVM